MKIAFAGKGGVGKTTLAALFIKALANGGEKVLAVDCDPVTNLGRFLGIKDADKLTPIAEMKAMIGERMQTSPGSTFYKLNPKVDDIPDRFAIEIDNIRLIVMGTVRAGGSGCMCPESNFIKTLLSRLILDEKQSVVMDMEAGVEHLGRATAGFVDALFIVVEPNISSVIAAKRIAALAKDLKVKQILIIINKVKKNEEIDLVKENIPELPVAGHIPFNEGLAEFELGKKTDIEKTDSYLAMLKIKEGQCMKRANKGL